MTLTKVKFSSPSFFLVKFLYAIFYNMFSDKHRVIGAGGKQPINPPHKYKDVLTFTCLQRHGVFGCEVKRFQAHLFRGRFHSQPSECSAVKVLGVELRYSLQHSSLGPCHLGTRSFTSHPRFSFIPLGIQQYNLDWSLQTIPLAYWATAPAFKF